MLVTCPACGFTAEWTPTLLKCTCGSALEAAHWPVFQPELIDSAAAGANRYHHLWPTASRFDHITMGEGWTPLVRSHHKVPCVWWKLEYANPTGSYKDRGVAPMVSMLAAAGVRHVVEDSSGNAGASVAAYSARAEIHSTIFVPAYASPSKTAQISAYGAEIILVPGTRHQATLAAEQVHTESASYASHAWRPAMLAGLRGLAWEIWEQLNHEAPDWLVAPVGQGTLLLGAFQGFRSLLEAGLIDRLPRMVAVQAINCAPLYVAWQQQDPRPEDDWSQTVAEGISIPAPIRMTQLLEAIRITHGMVIQVTESEITRHQVELAHKGFFVEPTSAAAVAALDHVAAVANPEATVVVPLTGSGLKSPSRSHA